MEGRRLVRCDSIEGIGRLSPKRPIRRKRTGSGILRRDFSVANVRKTLYEVPKALSPREFDPLEFPRQPPSESYNPKKETIWQYMDRINQDHKDHQLDIEIWKQRVRMIDRVELFDAWIRRVDPKCNIKSADKVMDMWEKRVLEIYKALPNKPTPETVRGRPRRTTEPVAWMQRADEDFYTWIRGVDPKFKLRNAFEILDMWMEQTNPRF